jgi:hypothetical protein
MLCILDGGARRPVREYLVPGRDLRLALCDECVVLCVQHRVLCFHQPRAVG